MASKAPAKTSGGITHNADGTYSKGGKVLSGAQSLSQARNIAAGKAATGGNVGGTKSSLPGISNSDYTSPSGALQGTYSTLPSFVGQGNLAQNGNVNGPVSNTTSTVDPNTGQLTQNTTLSPQDAQNLASVQQAGTQARNNQFNILNSGGALGGYSGASTPGQAAQTDPYTKAVYGQLTSLLQPQWDQQKAATDQQLENRGIPIGSKGYNDVENNLQNQFSQQYQNAANQAVTSGAGIQNQSVNTLQGINAQGYVAPNIPTQNNVNYAGLYNYTPINSGQVFGQLANQNLAAQASMVGAQAQAKNAGTAASQAGFQDAFTTWLANGGANQGGNVTQPGNGTGVPQG